MQKIVVDTNVFISSLIGKSHPHKIIKELILRGKVELHFSPEIFNEYEQVLQYSKFKKVKGFYVEAMDLLFDLKQIIYFHTPQVRLDILTDEDDNKFLELLAEFPIDFLITGNSKHFIFNTFGKSMIVSPSYYWNEFGKNL